MDAAAADHHRLHLAASRLTAHHQGSAAVPVRDVPQEYTEPEWRSDAPAPYTVTEPDGTGVRTLTSPDGAVVRTVHAVPHDGASFFHALIAAAGERGRWPGCSEPTSPTGSPPHRATPRSPPTPSTPPATASPGSWAAGQQDLLDSSPRTPPTPSHRRSWTARASRCPGSSRPSSTPSAACRRRSGRQPAQRAALASLALARPFATEPLPADAARPDDTPAPPARRAGDHGGADLLPALAARLLGTSLTVVTGEGREQRFLPYRDDRDGAARDGSATVDPAADPVLFAADGHFHAALSAHAPPRPPPRCRHRHPRAPARPARPRPRAASRPSRPRTAATPPPLAPPADGDVPRYRLARDGVLAAPDGATYTQERPPAAATASSAPCPPRCDMPPPDRTWTAGRPAGCGRARRRVACPAHEAERPAGHLGRADRALLAAAPGAAPGRPEPSAEAKEGHLRRHLAEAPGPPPGPTWRSPAGPPPRPAPPSPSSRRTAPPTPTSAPAGTAARTCGSAVGAATSSPDRAHAAPTTRTSPTDGTGPDTTATATTATVPLPPSTPASLSSTPPPSPLPSPTETTTDGRRPPRPQPTPPQPTPPQPTPPRPRPTPGPRPTPSPGPTPTPIHLGSTATTRTS